MFYALSIILFVALIGLSILKRQHSKGVQRQIHNYINELDEGETPDEDRIARFRSNNEFPVPAIVGRLVGGLAVLSLAWAVFNTLFFYAQPGYSYHVRTWGGDEIAYINETGWEYKGGGWVNDWKHAMSVQAAEGGDDSVNAEQEGGASMSATLPALNVIMLDQVDADVYATARFRLPSTPETFLAMAREYRSPENLIRTALIPAFKSTLQATGSLMSAEEYFSGGRTEFDSEFENQMAQGTYVVRRTEVIEKLNRAQTAKGSANASKGTEQEEFGDDQKVVFKVEKQYESDGVTPKRKKQKFVDFGIEMVEARVVNLIPNTKFKSRMDLKQKASADRAIAREQRVQEEEQRLLAIAKGDREVAERQAQAKVVQIEKTTAAETEKQLAITKAMKLKEQAEIEKETAKIILERDKIAAQSTKTLADAEAYKKEQIIKADNALQQKLDAEVEIQKVWAEAYAKRAVPSQVFTTGGGAGGTPTGGDSEVANFMNIMTMDAAKRLNYDRDIGVSK